MLVRSLYRFGTVQVVTYGIRGPLAHGGDVLWKRLVLERYSWRAVRRRSQIQRVPSLLFNFLDLFRLFVRRVSRGHDFAFGSTVWYVDFSTTPY